MIFIIIFLLVVPIGYLVKYTLSMSKRLPEEVKKETGQTADCFVFPGNVIITKHFIVHGSTYMKIVDTTKILREHYDSNPIYNKFYNDSVAIIDEGGKEITIEYKVAKGEQSCLDEITNILMQRNLKITQGSYYRQLLSE